MQSPFSLSLNMVFPKSGRDNRFFFCSGISRLVLHQGFCFLYSIFGVAVFRLDFQLDFFLMGFICGLYILKAQLFNRLQTLSVTRSTYGGNCRTKVNMNLVFFHIPNCRTVKKRCIFEILSRHNFNCFLTFNLVIF